MITKDRPRQSYGKWRLLSVWSLWLLQKKTIPSRTHSRPSEFWKKNVTTVESWFLDKVKLLSLSLFLVSQRWLQSGMKWAVVRKAREWHMNKTMEERMKEPIPKNIWAKICNCLNCDYNCDNHVSISSVFPQFQSTSFHKMLIVAYKHVAQSKYNKSEIEQTQRPTSCSSD